MKDEKLRLAALRALHILDTPPEERFDRIARLAQRTFRVPMVLIGLIDEQRVWFKSRLGLEMAEMPREGSFCGEAVRSEELTLVPDATNDPRFAANPLVAGAPHVRFYAGQPLAGPDGNIVGTLSLIDITPRELDLEQRRALRDLAEMVEEQLAAPAHGASTLSDDHSRLLARLRQTPEIVAGRRRIRAFFFALLATLVLVTGISMRLAGKVVAESDKIEALEAADGQTPATGPEADALLSMHKTAKFLRVALGARALIAATLLFVMLLIFDRHMDSRLAVMAGVELDRARLRAIIDAIGDGVVVADARGRVTMFNPAAERILGLDALDVSKAAGGFYASFFREADGVACPPERHPLMRAVYGETLHGERLVVRNERRPSGVAVSITATPVRSFDDHAAGGVILFRDVV